MRLGTPRSEQWGPISRSKPLSGLMKVDSGWNSFVSFCEQKKRRRKSDREILTRSIHLVREELVDWDVTSDVRLLSHPTRLTTRNERKWYFYPTLTKKFTMSDGKRSTIQKQWYPQRDSRQLLCKHYLVPKRNNKPIDSHCDGLILSKCDPLGYSLLPLHLFIRYKANHGTRNACLRKCYGCNNTLPLSTSNQA